MNDYIEAGTVTDDYMDAGDRVMHGAITEEQLTAYMNILSFYQDGCSLWGR